MCKIIIFFVMFHKNKKTFFVSVLAFLLVNACIFAADNTLTVLTDEQIFTSKDNGMIVAMCTIMDLLTGNFARVIFVLFTIYIGWGYLVGTTKDHKPVLPFILAISITLGAANIANILTKNNYTCNYIKELERIDENNVYNSGQCIISDLDVYDYRQKWFSCGISNGSNNYDISECKNLVTNETDIKSNNNNQVVVLGNCQEGYLKDDMNKYLFYSCLQSESITGDKLYEFKLVKPTTQSDIDSAMCKKACSVDNLKKVADSYNIDYNSLTTVSTDAKKHGNYYTQGYKFAGNCANGYFEYIYNEDKKNNLNSIKFTSNKTNGITVSDSFLGANAYKLINGFDGSVSIGRWNSYWFNIDYAKNTLIKSYSITADSYSGTEYPTSWSLKASKNGSKWVELDSKFGQEFSSGETKEYKVNTDDAYNMYRIVFNSGKETDGNGEIKKIEFIVENYNEDSYDRNEDGLFITCSENGTFSVSGLCRSNCNLNNVSLNKVVSTWKKCNGDVCEKTSGSIFGYGDVLEVGDCNDGYFLSSSHKNNTRIKCSENGSWILIGSYDEGEFDTGNSCVKKCRVGDIDSYSNVSKFVMDCKVNDKNCNASLEITEDTLLEKDQSVKIKSCVDSAYFDYFDNSNGVYTCNKDGKWELEKGTSGCFKRCDFNEVKKKYPNIAFLTQVDDNNKIIEGQQTINAAQLSEIDNGQNLMVSYCDNGFSVDKNSKALTISCKKGELTYKNTSNFCKANCLIKDIFNSFSPENISWKEVDDNYNFIDGTDSINVNSSIQNVENGTFYKLYTCAEGYSILDNDPIVIGCRNSKWDVKLNKNNICMRTCDNSLLRSKELSSIMNGVKSVIKSTNTGVPLDNASSINLENLTDSSNSGEYFTINECVDGYGLSKTNGLVLKCLNGIWNVSRNNNILCYPKCNKQNLIKLFGDNVDTIYESKSNGKIIGENDIISSSDTLLNLDTYYVISTCKDGYKILNNKSIIVRCNKNGVVDTYSNIDNKCVPINN